MKDVIIALDFPGREETLRFLGLFGAERPWFKIGMELFYREGPDIVRAIRDMGCPVFLDLKLHDIPNTVKRAMRSLANLGVNMTNVHAAGTKAMMEAALEGLTPSEGERAKLLAVTQLTSTSEEVMRRELLIDATMPETVAAYARNARAAGLDGVVCSPLEARLVKENCGGAFLTVTPGIRFADSKADDQARIMTPDKAFDSDYIVVGRPITAAEDPLAAYRRCAADFARTK